MQRAHSESALPHERLQATGIRKAFSSDGMAASSALPALALPGIGSRAAFSSILHDRAARSVLPAAAVGALGAFACGISLGELNTPAGVVREALGIPMLLPGLFGVPTHVLTHDVIWGSAVAALSLGGLVGTRTILALAQRRGRRPALLLCATLHVVGGLLQACAGLLPLLSAPPAAMPQGTSPLHHHSYDDPPPAGVLRAEAGGDLDWEDWAVLGGFSAGWPATDRGAASPLRGARSGVGGGWFGPLGGLGAVTPGHTGPQWLQLLLLLLGRAASGGACGGCV